MAEADEAMDKLYFAFELERRAACLRQDAERVLAARSHAQRGEHRFYQCVPRGCRKRDMAPGSVLQECPYDQKPRGCGKIDECCFQHRERRATTRPRMQQRAQHRSRGGGSGPSGSDGAPGGAGGGCGSAAGPRASNDAQGETELGRARVADTEPRRDAGDAQQEAAENAAKDHLARLLLQGDNNALEAGVLAAIHDMLGV